MNPSLSLASLRNMLIFRKSGLVLTSRIMEGSYPELSTSCSQRNLERNLLYPEKTLEGALRRVSLLSKDKSYAVKVTIDTRVECSLIFQQS